MVSYLLIFKSIGGNFIVFILLILNLQILYLYYCIFIAIHLKQSNNNYAEEDINR